MRNNDLDASIDALAQRQHGAFARSQAIERGATVKMIRVRVSNGRWVAVSPSVFALPSHPTTWDQRVMTAVLGAPGSVASGNTAAALHELPGFRGGRPELTVPPGSHRHTSAAVRQSALVDVEHVRGIPTNSAAMTLIELAGRVPYSVLERALEGGLRTRALRLAELDHQLVRLRASRRPGLQALMALVGERIGGGAPSASELERIFYKTFDCSALSPFVRQPRLPWSTMGERGDGLVVPTRLLLEADGRAWHEQLKAMANDRRRDRLAVAHGFEPIRVTWNEMHDKGPEVLAEVADIHQRVLVRLAS